MTEPRPSYVSIDAEKCTGCAACLPSCPRRAISARRDAWFIVMDASGCDGCGRCLTTCFEGAMSLVAEGGSPRAQVRLARCSRCERPHVAENLLARVRERLQGPAAVTGRIEVCVRCRIDEDRASFERAGVRMGPAFGEVG